MITAGVAPDGDPAGVGRVAPLTFLASMLCLTGRRPSRPGPVSGTTPLRRARLPPAVGRRPRPAGALAPGRLDRRRRQGHRPAAPRRSARHAPCRRAPSRSGPPSSTGKAPPSRPTAWPPDCRRGGSPAPCTGCGSPGVGLVDWQFLVDPYPAVRAATPTGESFEYERPAGLYSAGPGGDLALARPKPFLAGFTLPVRPPAGEPQPGPRMGAAAARSGDGPAAVRAHRPRALAHAGAPAMPPRPACSTRWSACAARACCG